MQGNMHPMTVETLSEHAQPHWLYDLSIEDLEERRSKRLWFPAGHKLANYLGVAPKEIYDKRAPGHKLFSKRHNRWFAIRLANKNESIPNECKNRAY